MKINHFILCFFCVFYSYAQCWREIAGGGGNHKVAIKTDGTLWASGTTWFISYNGFEQIGSDHDWKQVSTGKYHFLATKNDGTLWAWGKNNYGQLGDGTLIDKNFPVQIGTDTDWKYVFAGYDSTNIAIKTDGTLWVWGYNYSNFLGIAWADINIPTQIGTDSDWLTAVIGNNHCLAVKVDGSLWSWGGNNSGQLGYVLSGIPTNMPRRVGNDYDWKLVSASLGTSAAIKNDGTLWMWGNNYYGALGNGNQTNLDEPTQVGTDSDWIDVSSEMEFTLALKSNHTLWAWGDNSFGELGNGSVAPSYTPIQTANFAYLIVTDQWEKIATDSHLTSVIRADNTLWQWGHNFTGISRPVKENCTNLEIPSFTKQTDFLIHPNPSSDYISVFNMTDYPMQKVIITDVLGKRKLEIHQNFDVIDVRGLSAGCYFINVISEDKVSTLKFIKQ